MAAFQTVCHQVAEHDQNETRVWNELQRGIYVSAPEQGEEWVHPKARTLIACYVSLRLAAAALGTASSWKVRP